MSETATLTAHYALARWMASTAYHQIPFDDRLQACLLGVLLALRYFDAERGYRFSSYAVRCMASELQKLAAAQGYQISMPVQVVPVTRRAGEARALGQAPDIERIRGKVARPAAEAASMMAGRSLELDDATTPSLSPCPLRVTEDRIDAEETSRALVACLSERERWYVLEHYVSGRCYADIAREVGLSRERVRQIVGAAIGKIKKMMSEC